MNVAQTLLQAWLPKPVDHLALALAQKRTMKYFGKVLDVPNAAILPQPPDYPYVDKDKNGDPYFVWRGSALPRRQRPGRRDRTVSKSPLLAAPYGKPYAAAVRQHGSQRMAAAALGISLGKLQRELRK